MASFQDEDEHYGIELPGGGPGLEGGGDGSVLLSTHWDILKCPEYRGGLVSGMG